MKIKANGITINYQLDGPEGAPWLVLSNSLATNLTMWDEQARELGRSFRVLRYDQRGHGGSEATGGRYTFDLLIADALALMDALAIGKAHFAGLSMGGATALGSTRPRRRLRLAVSVDAGEQPAMGGAHCDRAKAGHGGAGRTDDVPLVPARGDAGQSTAPR
jgi:3-oxoadipate enol-lactonase